MNVHIPTTTRRLLRATALATATTLGTLALAAGDASASEPEVSEWLPDRVSHHAELALDSLSEFESNGDAKSLRRYERRRAYAAIYAAEHLGYSEQQMVRAWSETPLTHQKAVLGALTQLGVPYRYMSSEEGVGFDCSGLTSFSWRHAGLELFRNSGSQISSARSLSRDDAKAGDLAYYPGHVMIYLGIEGAIVHSVMTGRDVELDHMSSRTHSFGDPTG